MAPALGGVAQARFQDHNWGTATCADQSYVVTPRVDYANVGLGSLCRLGTARHDAHCDYECREEASVADQHVISPVLRLPQLLPQCQLRMIVPFTYENSSNISQGDCWLVCRGVNHLDEKSPALQVLPSVRSCLIQQAKSLIELVCTN